MLKFKITSKGIRNCTEEKVSDETLKNKSQSKVPGVGKELSEFDMAQKLTTPAISKKRGPEVSLQSRRGKLRKMDRSVKLQCDSLLSELMNSHGGWIFNNPVDPVKLNIPDYFSIITQPMDLGTIKEKLKSNLYSSADEFAADVRLTFSNAMVYNPPGNEVHKIAKKFNGEFCMKWKLLDAKWKRAHVAFDVERGRQDFKKAVENDCQDSTLAGVKRATLRINLSSNRPMPLEEKQKLKLELVELSSGKMMANLGAIFDKFGLAGFKEEVLQSYIDSTDDKTLWKLRREIKVFVRSSQQVESAKMAQNEGPLAGKTFQKGAEKCCQTVCPSTDLRHSTDFTGSKCSSCVSWCCHCHVESVSAQATSSDLSSDRSQELSHCDDSNFELEVRCPMTPHDRGLGPDSDGPGVVVNKENNSCLSTPATIAASGEGWTPINIQMSPKKALRAAMLKSRFADTIFRATHGGKSNCAQMQKEKERLEREQLEEKERIEKEIKAAEAAMQMKVQAELKMQRERDREAARIALLKVEKTVEINENLNIMKDLEILCCGSPPDENGCAGVGTGLPRTFLEQLGLYMKVDYLEEDEDTILNGEDGEILS